MKPSVFLNYAPCATVRTINRRDQGLAPCVPELTTVEEHSHESETDSARNTCFFSHTRCTGSARKERKRADLPCHRGRAYGQGSRLPVPERTDQDRFPGHGPAALCKG